MKERNAEPRLSAIAFDEQPTPTRKTNMRPTIGPELCAALFAIVLAAPLAAGCATARSASDPAPARACPIELHAASDAGGEAIDDPAAAARSERVACVTSASSDCRARLGHAATGDTLSACLAERIEPCEERYRGERALIAENVAPVLCARR
jgi:hypothetical protein